VPSVFVDTKVIAYRFDASEPVKQAQAATALQSDQDFVISTQVMLELHSVLTRKLRPAMSLSEARLVLDGLAEAPVVVRRPPGRPRRSHARGTPDLDLGRHDRRGGCGGRLRRALVRRPGSGHPAQGRSRREPLRVMV